MFPEIRDLAHIESRLLRNMASDDMRFAHYNLMAKEIKKELESDKNLKGIIITQGTDTIHYTSAALSFIFENLPIPVVITGAQRSSDRGSTDAAMNLISAVAFIANTSLKGVFICFHENISDDNCIILNGLNAKKFHSSRRDAFKPINIPPIARINYLTKDIDYISEYPQSALNSEGTLKLHLFDEDLKIAIIVSHPNMSASEFEPYKDFDGIILEGTGLCHFPIKTVYGTVNMNVYSPGRALLEMGIIGNYSSLCTETSFVKLAWLLSQKLDPKEYFMKDLRGEFSNKEMGE
jgi:glutamyl-tRNA(Gln) amidotransferase subunit D